MKFEAYAISAEIKRSLEELDFKRPTDIQFKAIPPILKGEDVLAIAQTGTGKTAAFAIPVLHLLQEDRSAKNRHEIRCLVMVPTRELAAQIADVFKGLAKYTSLRILSLIGGIQQDPQIKLLEKGIDVLIATPGRMFDLISQGHISLQQTRILVLDEADQMLDRGFLKDIQDVLRKLPHRHQTLFFSATINETIKELAYSVVHKPIRIQISPKDPVSKNITHSVAFIEMDDKRAFLERMVKENPDSKILVFVRTKVRAERVCQAMERVNIKSLSMHGDKDQTDRLKVMDEFRKGNVKMVVATDVSARGIDIANVDYVVNYDIPEEAENYVHRVGRTGRGVKKGIAVSFCSTDEKPLLKEIEKFLGQEIAVVEIDKQSYTQTLDFSEDTDSDWRKLLKTEEENSKKFPKKKKK